MSEVPARSNVSDSSPSFGPTTFWEVGVLATLYSAVFFCGLLFNSAVLGTIKSLPRSGRTVVNQLIACQSVAGIAAIAIAVPLYLYLLTTGNRHPALCNFYDWYLFFFCALMCCFIIALGLLRYLYVFHFRLLQKFRQKTILVLPLAFTFATTILYCCVRYFLESPSDKGIRITLCSTGVTTTYKNYWPIVLSSHLWIVVLGSAYFRILRKLGSFIPGKDVPPPSVKKVNLVDARTSALTAIVLECAILMAQIWNIINPEILPVQYQFFFQEMSSIFVYVTHFVPAMLYYLNQQESPRRWKILFQRAIPCYRSTNKIEILTIDYPSMDIFPAETHVNCP